MLTVNSLPQMTSTVQQQCDCYIDSECITHNNSIQFKVGPSQWTMTQDGSYLASGGTYASLPSKLYSCLFSPQGVTFSPVDIAVDELISFSEGAAHEISNEIKGFWTKTENFAKHKLLHKRGYLLHGRPGCGKTSVLHQVIAVTLDAGGLALTGSLGPMSAALVTLRKVEPNRPVICIHEDIDNYVQDSRYETELLSMLDGENQVNHVIHLATTNYIDQLSPRIKNRPRRFDRVVEIELPNERTRFGYFTQKLFLDPEEAHTWVQDTHGFSFAGLTELIASVKCLGNPYAEMLEKIRKLEETPEEIQE